MSNEEYEDPHDSCRVWKHTSKWKPFQLDILKINFQTGKIEDIIGNVDINNAILNDDIDRILLPGINIADSVVYDLLTWTEFEDINIHFRPQPKLAMKWRDYNVSSKADFCVYSDISIDQAPFEYLMIVEDKSACASTYQNGECQLAGEMLLAAYNRFENIQNDQIINGIILKDSLVRFYKVTFSELYLQELRKSKYPTTAIKPITFPPHTERALSLNIYEQREKNIKMLRILKQKMEGLISY